MDSSEETGCQASEGPILCINNCGFFGSAVTMNMCSKCHKEMLVKREQAELAASSIESIVNGSSSTSNDKVPIVSSFFDLVGPVDTNAVHAPSAFTFGCTATKPKEGPKRCTTCNKRVGLTGFHCRCGNLFCGTHRYSDKHDCPFDYRTAAQDAIAKSNPVVKTEKLDKI